MQPVSNLMARVVHHAVLTLFQLEAMLLAKIVVLTVTIVTSPLVNVSYVNKDMPQLAISTAVNVSITHTPTVLVTAYHATSHA